VAAGKSFDNRDKIKKIMCPLLVIHGSEDHVIPISMGRKVFANATTKKNLWKSRADTTKTFLALTKKSTGER
jgi:pimeloyl-ACP methyl ester carboxylesterase